MDTKKVDILHAALKLIFDAIDADKDSGISKDEYKQTTSKIVVLFIF